MTLEADISNAQIYYFPPCGFGFWYLLGIYEVIKNQKNSILIGASAGSLICVCSLLKKEDLINNVIKCANETKEEYINNKKTYFYNFYNITYLFIDKLFKYIDRENLEYNLKKIRIQTTEVSGLTYIVKHQIEAKTLEHLRELVLASCYIPLLSNYNNLLYYIVDGKKMCDGIIVDLYIKNMYTTFDVSKYKSLSYLLIIPSNTTIMNMYNNGVNDGLLYKKQLNNSEPINLLLIPYNYYLFISFFIFLYYFYTTFKIF